MKQILDVRVPPSDVGLGKLRRKMSYSQMIASAVEALKLRKGASRHAIAKYLQNNFDVPIENVNRNVTKNLKQMVSNEQLLLTSGVGAAGRFKLNKAVEASKSDILLTGRFKLNKKSAHSQGDVKSKGRFKLKKKPGASQSASGDAKNRKAKKPASPKKKRIVKKSSNKKKTPVKKKTAKRTGKKPTKPGKRTGKKQPNKKPRK